MRVPKSRIILANQEDQEREVEFQDEVHATLGRKQKILEDPDKVRTLRDKLLLRAREARENFPAFFNFVSVNEHTRERMTMAAHQRVFMDFVEKHDRAVVMLPIGHAKTISSAWFATYLLGVDPTTRGAIVSNTQDQASKPLAMVRQYIETSARLRLVFPKLQRSRREGDPWTQTKLTIDRPMGIRDASLMAVGYQGAIEGSRLNFILVDDILDPENTNTKEQRDKLYEWIRISVLSRLDPRGSRFVFTNTPYHPEDAAHQLKKIGWPTIIMRLSGDIEISTPAQEVAPNVWTEDRWGIDDAIAHELRPKSPGSPICRLTAHDPDPTNGQTLWPERIPPEMIPRLKREYGTIVFNKVFEMEVRDDSTSMVKREWIEACKKKAREAGIHKFRDRYNHDILYAPTFTGVDLAVKKSDSADDTCFFTFAVLPTGDLLILDIDIGKLNGPEIINKIVEKHERYGSIITVESNAAQSFIAQFALDRNIAIPVREYMTTTTKNSIWHGVPQMFVLLENNAWLIPNMPDGTMHPNMERWVNGCLYYTPSDHTDDSVMASWMAYEEARRSGFLSKIGREHMDQGDGRRVDPIAAATGGLLSR